MWNCTNLMPIICYQMKHTLLFLLKKNQRDNYDCNMFWSNGTEWYQY